MAVSAGSMGGMARGGGQKGAGAGVLLQLGATLRIRCGGTERVEKVRGQPTWSFGRHGLCLRRAVYWSWGLGHSNKGGGRESWGLVCGIKG